MPIQIGWANPEQTAIHWVFDETWNIKDLKQATAEAEGMFYSVEHIVHSIIQFEPGARLPGNIINITRRAFTAQAFDHPNTGIQYLVAPPQIAIRVIEILGLVYPKIKNMIRIMPTADAALLDIHERNAKPPFDPKTSG